MKIFKLSDDEIYFGQTLEDCFKAAEEHSGQTEAEYRKDFEPEEIQEDKWDTDSVDETDDDGVTVSSISFREALEQCTLNGEKMGYLCGSEI